MSEQSNKFVVDVNITIRVPAALLASGGSGGLEQPSLELSKNRFVVSPCGHCPVSSIRSVSYPNVNQDSRAARETDSRIAIENALPDCFGLNPYHQLISPSQRTLNKRERCLDSVRDIARLPNPFSGANDNSTPCVPIKERTGQDAGSVSSTTISSVDRRRNRWYSDSSLYDLAAIASPFEEGCFCKAGVGEKLPKDVSVSPTESPTPPNQQPLTKTFADRYDYTPEVLDQLFNSSPSNCNDGKIDRPAASGLLSTTSLKSDVSVPGNVRRYSPESLCELAAIPSISKIRLDGSPNNAKSPFPPSEYQLSYAESPTSRSAVQYYTLAPTIVPASNQSVDALLQGSKQPMFFLAKPVQRVDASVQPLLLYHCPEQTLASNKTTNPYAYLPKRRHHLSTESLADISDVPMNFSPRKDDKN